MEKVFTQEEKDILRKEQLEKAEKKTNKQGKVEVKLEGDDFFQVVKEGEV